MRCRAGAGGGRRWHGRVTETKNTHLSIDCAEIPTAGAVQSQYKGMERTLEPGGSPADLPRYETFSRVL